ncbi:MAG: hypothetical protein OCD03_13125 [Hyphomicrobiales bacterium]
MEKLIYLSFSFFAAFSVFMWNNRFITARARDAIINSEIDKVISELSEYNEIVKRTYVEDESVSSNPKFDQVQLSNTSYYGLLKSLELLHNRFDEVNDYQLNMSVIFEHATSDDAFNTGSQLDNIDVYLITHQQIQYLIGLLEDDKVFRKPTIKFWL